MGSAKFGYLESINLQYMETYKYQNKELFGHWLFWKLTD